MNSRDLKKLYDWHKKNKRDLPFRNTKDPYRIWVSEIMLQQTRVSTMTEKYTAFMKRFPDIKSLAESQEDEVLELWRGLGYYSRAKNIRKSAKIIQKEFNGRFPENYKDAVSLPGIGDYTASAVLSLAYGESHAVLDGNVKRVLSRVFYRTDHAVDLNGLSLELLERGRSDPGLHNESLMELGATLCSSGVPKCGVCPLAPVCSISKNYTPEFAADVPQKIHLQKINVDMYVHLLLTPDLKKILIQKKSKSYFFRNLWYFPSVIVHDDKKMDPSGLILSDALDRKKIIESKTFNSICKHTITKHSIDVHLRFEKMRKKDIEKIFLDNKDSQYMLIDSKDTGKWVISSLKDKIFTFLRKNGYSEFQSVIAAE